MSAGAEHHDPKPAAVTRSRGRVQSMELVFNAIRSAGELSRPSIAEEIGISLPTVISLTAELERIGLVKKAGDSAGSLGRPAALYSVNGRAGYVLAVDLGARKVTACVSDLHGSVLGELTEPTERGSLDVIVAQIVDLRDRLIDRAGVSRSTVGVASVGVGGVVHADATLSRTNLPELEGVRLEEAVEYALGIHTSVENDLNLAVIAEQHEGRAQGLTNVIMLSVGSGTGMGIMIEGRLYRGSRGAAGEIAALPVRDRHSGGELRTFEDTAAGTGILRQRDTLLAAGRPTTLSTRSDVVDIFDAAYANDDVAVEIIEREAEQLAVGLTSAIALLDPELVVCAGSIGSQPLLVDAMTKSVERLLSTTPPVTITSLGSRGTLRGAITTALGTAHDLILTGVVQSTASRDG